ncbi:unnamed protein product [Symbiodinium sp. CCMP2456]|nr:unnamed protein product [Symbiodinium sp. CCMP2456]
MLHRLLAIVLLSAARAQTCGEDDQTCQQPGNLGEEGTFMQVRVADESVDGSTEGSQTNTSMASYVEKVLGKVTALGGSHQNNVELAKDEVRNLAIQLAADPDYTVFNVSQSNMHDAFERIIAEMEEIINDTLVSLDKDHKEFDIMIDNILKCGVNLKASNVSDFSVPLYFDNAIDCASSVAAVIAKYQACDRTQLTYATKELILKSNSSRHVAFIAARQVQCYIRVLQSDNLTMAAIEACDYKLVDTSPLALTVPTIPPKPACDVSLVAEHPCGTAWLTKNYQDVTKYWVAEQIAHATCGGLSTV